jgi:hypothetical protein
MGLFSRFKDSEKRKSTNGINVSNLKSTLPPVSIAEPPSYNPKPKLTSYTSAVQDTEQIEGKKAEEIARCSKLLRQMYTLDLRIWGMQHAVGDEARQSEELKFRANAMFAEVQKVVTGWANFPEDKWTAEEQQQIQRIYRILREHDGSRY